MKKLISLLAVVGVALSVLVGCTTIKQLTPAQVDSIAVVITQTANSGATYAIQQDNRNATYFQLATASIDTFLLGKDLSPASLQAALAKVPGASNQWVNLAVSGVVVAYDVSYHQYVTDQVLTNYAAVAWVTAVETGFKQALEQNGTVTMRAGAQPAVPYFVKDGAVDKAAIAAKVKAAKK